jgi:hypothetical protein
MSNWPGKSALQEFNIITSPENTRASFVANLSAVSGYYRESAELN